MAGQPRVFSDVLRVAQLGGRFRRRHPCYLRRKRKHPTPAARIRSISMVIESPSKGEIGPGAMTTTIGIAIAVAE
jgi:hypothetical protein